MKHIVILVTVFALFTTGAALAGTQPAGDCTCPAATQNDGTGLRGAELAP